MADASEALEVLIVEDSATDTKLVVQELRRCGFAPKWERVETAADLRKALQRGSWRLVISDSSVPRLNALDALAATRELLPGVPFIVVSGTISEEGAVAAMRMGAADYVTKDHLERLGPAVVRELRAASRHGATQPTHDRLAEILAALKVAIDAVPGRRGGQEAKSLAEASSLADRALRLARDLEDPPWPPGRDDAAEPSSDTTKLTPRQREILQLIAEGHSTKQIALRLKISAKTVESHRAQIMERLDIHHVAGLVHYAIRRGIIRPDV